MIIYKVILLYLTIKTIKQWVAVLSYISFYLIHKERNQPNYMKKIIDSTSKISSCGWSFDAISLTYSEPLVETIALTRFLSNI